MHTLGTLLPILAAAFGVPQFVPQILRLRRLDHPAGVSWTWAALTCIDNIAWFAYFVMARFWTSLIPSSSVALLSGVLMVMVMRRMHRAPARAGWFVTAWSSALIVVTIFFGRLGLGTTLALAFLVQVAPSVWLAATATNMAASSSATWFLICGEQVSWGVFGVYASDVRLMILGISGLVASVFVLVRIAQTTSTPAAVLVNHTEEPSSHADSPRTPSPGRRRP